MTTEFNQLVRKLVTQERVVQELFFVVPLPAILKEKLSELQQMVVNIPIHFEEQFYTEWSHKIAFWWRRYVEAANVDNSISENSEPKSTLNDVSDCSIHLYQSEKQSNSTFLSESSKEDENALVSNSPNILDLPNSYGSSNFKPSPSIIDKELLNESICVEIKHRFDRIENVCLDQEDALKELIKLINRVRALTLPFWRDVQLQEKLFYLAFQKLSPTYSSIYQQLLDRYQRAKSLGDLYNFLVDQVNHFSRPNSAISNHDHISHDAKLIAIDRIRNQMKSVFTRLCQVESTFDLEGLKKLHLAVHAARLLTGQFYKKTWLLKEMFDLAFPKLPLQFRHKYSELYDYKQKSLCDLFVFIADQMAMLSGREKISKTISSRIEEQFASLPRVVSSECEEMRNLLLAISNSVNIVSHENNPDYKLFHRRIFNCAFAKLSEQLHKQYEHIYGRTYLSQSLSTLRKFIANQLANQDTALKLSLSKEEIRAQMEHELMQCENMQTCDDIDGLKNLLDVASKGTRLVWSFPPNDQLSVHLFEIVLAKLPIDIQHKYTQQRSALRFYKTMYDLQSFIIVYITSYYQELNFVKNDQIQKMSDTFRQNNENVKNNQFCYYCKSMGHYCNDCPNLKKLICFKCFRQGHKARHCHTVVCIECSQSGHVSTFCPNTKGRA